jgi:hypothetical protein
LASGSYPEKLFYRPHHHQIHGQFTVKRRAYMADSVTLFPNIIQPTAALKSYAPIGVKFWESQQAALDSIKDYSDGWFTRRQSGAQATLAAAKRISEAATPVDMHREYHGADDRGRRCRSTAILQGRKPAERTIVVRGGSGQGGGGSATF